MVEGKEPEPGFSTLSDLEEAARPKVIEPIWQYVQTGAGIERTLRANREAFESRALVPRVFADVRKIDLSTSMLGSRVASPFFVCPTAYQGLVHPDGEVGTAKGASEAGVLMVLSTLSSNSLEEVAEAAPAGPRWFQLYPQNEPAKSERLIRRAESAGYRAIVVTVDVPVLGIRDHQAQGGIALDSAIPLGNGEEFVTPPRGPEGSGASFTVPDYGIVTEEVLDQVRKLTRLPLVVKGILSADDARTAVEHGAQGIVVSNHGGRQLDGAPATLDVLEDVVEAVGDRAEVYMDGGVRRGSDILMALALGARAVGLGRPVLWALAAGGSVGVAHLLAILQKELANVMALSGRRNVSEIDGSLIAVR